MASPFACFPGLDGVAARGYIAHTDRGPDIVVAMDFAGKAFPEFRSLIAGDQAINASARVVAIAATTAFAFDARYYQRGDDGVLTRAVDQFAFTPAMCETIVGADDGCDTAHVSVVKRRVTCFRKKDGQDDAWVPADKPTDAQAILHPRIADFMSWMDAADRAVTEAEADLVGLGVV